MGEGKMREREVWNKGKRGEKASSNFFSTLSNKNKIQTQLFIFTY